MAALAVLTLPLVATFMPKYPAKTDRHAPTRYSIAVVQLFRPRPSAKNKTATTKIIVLYSLVRNAIAPSLM